MSKSEHTIDLLLGAEKIGRYLCGEQDDYRFVYNIASARTLPIFRVGRHLAARREALDARIEELERESLKPRERAA